MFFHDTYVINNGKEISHDEIEENNKAIEDIVNKLITSSPVFQGLKASTIIRGIKSGKIPIVEIAPQIEIIKQ